MDFGMFGVNPDQMNAFRAFIASQQQAQANQQQQQQQSGSTGGDGEGGNSNGAPGSGDGQQEGPVFMHNSAHNGVVCDICNEEIRGFRYKCAQCPDYDLCSKCEHKGHHAGHVMLRISFPEQARDAIRKYLSNAPSSCPPSPPHGPWPHNGHGPHPPPPFTGIGELFGHGRRGHGYRRRGHGNSESQAEDAERPSTAPGAGCPYNMGKKEFKRWSKWMKRAATHQHRSAEAYARAAAASGGAAGAAGAGSDSEPESPVDFAAVASQIQEFLNYWGIPVDVVELYDQFGNRGQTQGQPQNQQPQTGENATTEQNQASGEAASTSASAANAGAGSGKTAAEATGTSTTIEAQSTVPATAAAANLSENMQQMTIDDNQNQNNNASASAPQEESMLVDLDAVTSGWTILNDSREQSPTGSTTGQQQTGEAVTAAAATAPPQSQPSTGSSSATESVNSNNGNPSTPFVSAASSSSGQATTTPTAPSYPIGLPNVPLYPVLNPPQIQQILQGVSSAVGSVVRSIPIVTDPRGPLGTNTTNSTQVPPAAAPADSEPQLDARSMKTLNQLLAMGFSNEGGYLTRLVVAKKGDLEAVLSSLFPN